MESHKVGILSALAASVCCVGPVLLAALGLGSLGVGAFIGEYHCRDPDIGVLFHVTFRRLEEEPKVGAGIPCLFGVSDLAEAG